MSFFKKTNRFDSSSKKVSNQPFIRGSASHLAKMDNKNHDEQVTRSTSDHKVVLNFFGEPAFFQPQFSVQARLQSGHGNDKYEKETKNVADKIVNNSDSVNIQKVTDTRIQKFDDPIGQTEGDSNPLKSSSTVESKLNSTKGSGTKLNDATRVEMESGFGRDFNQINIHTDSSAIQMNQELGAKAFTNGNDVYFNHGEYNPSSKEGKHLLAHELTHTIQQSNGSGSLHNIQTSLQRKPREEKRGVGGQKLYVTHDSKITYFKDYNNDGVIGFKNGTPYKGVKKGQVLSFTEGDQMYGTKYVAWFTKDGDFKGYFKGSPEGIHEKWVNPSHQYQDFNWQGNNDRLKTASYTDGGHYMGDEEYEPTYASQETTAEMSIKLVYHFTTAEGIEQWNEAVREIRGKLAKGAAATSAIAAKGIHFWIAFGLGIGVNELFERLTKPKDISMDPGGKIVFGTKMKVIRSTNESYLDDGMTMGDHIGKNGVSLSYYTQYINGGSTTNEIHSQGFFGVRPYTNSIGEDLLQKFEEYNGDNDRKYVENPDHGLMNFILRRTT